ncbi:hypothetical protein B0H17DRAFT_1067330 [Mycena rosella]|uniref:Uncharacterized protein n=1 Tax=Mycena rosella TaxID=1033263 RepID=A0AAD7GD80_MYCRO|nr:hypothetical protein B0H17DRAFT_1067330 [Mycena rosella]
MNTFFPGARSANRALFRACKRLIYTQTVPACCTPKSERVRTHIVVDRSRDAGRSSGARDCTPRSSVNMLLTGTRADLGADGAFRAGSRLLSTAATQRVRTRIVVDRDSDEPSLPREMPIIRNWLDDDDKVHTVRRLTTLSAAHLQPSDFMNLTYQRNPSISFVPHTLSFPIRFCKKDLQYQPFPEGTHGFLYYYTPPAHLPPTAGGVRFRITPSIRPATFADGADLLIEGLPWEVSLRTIASAIGRKVVLRDQLLAEDLVSPADLEQCRAAMPNKKRFDSKLALYTLHQPFPVSFAQSLHMWVVSVGVGAARTLPWTYAYMFADNRRQFRPLVRPYAGAALAQFELSALPEHSGTATVVMRIVKMLAPPTCVLPGYDGYLPAPAEGTLILRPMGKGRGVRLQPWFCDTDGPSDSAAALRLLVENSRVLASRG